MIKTLLVEEWRLLTFRAPGPAMNTHWRALLTVGLLFTWLAGSGRYWDNPKAYWWQILGLGSLGYVFLLSLFIWMLLAPLRPERWRYRNVLLFVSLTSPPAILYAIPVERFMGADAARSVNAWFLAVVALWRVALFACFLARVARLKTFAIVVGTLLPLTLIVVLLAVLNLEHVVFNLMGGINESSRSPNDAAYSVVVSISLFAVLAAPVLLLAFAWLVYRAWRDHRAAKLPSQPN